MSNYIFELEPATCAVKKNEIEAFAKAIKEAVSDSRWDHYGWKPNIMKAKDLYDIAKEFDIELIDEGDGTLRPYFNSTYQSGFFEDLTKIAAPFMTDGEIFINNEYSDIRIEYLNGELQPLEYREPNL